MSKKIIPAIVCSADASHCPKTGCAAWAATVSYDGKTDYLSSLCPEAQDSTHAEVLALMKVVEYLLYSVPIADRKIVLESDSTSALRHVTPQLQHLKHQGAGAAITRHVRGHQGAKNAQQAMNSWADCEAKRLMREARDRKLLEQTDHIFSGK